jgi:hypothetical protein
MSFLELIKEDENAIFITYFFIIAMASVCVYIGSKLSLNQTSKTQGNDGPSLRLPALL